MQTTSSRIWTWVTMPIYYDNNCHTKYASFFAFVFINKILKLNQKANINLYITDILWWVDEKINQLSSRRFSCKSAPDSFVYKG